MSHSSQHESLLRFVIDSVVWEVKHRIDFRGLHELIFVLVGQGLGNGDGLQNIHQADDDSQLEFVTKMVHCNSNWITQNVWHCYTRVIETGE